MTIQDIERETGVLILGLSEAQAKEKISGEDFENLKHTNGFAGVNYDDREQFLNDNDYPITRESLIDGELSHKG